MAAPFPFPLPLNAYAGLGNSFSELAGALNYTRIPVTLELTDDGTTVSNANTLEWCVAKSDWGPVSSVMVFDSPTGGNLLFSLPLSGTAIPYSWADYSEGLYSPMTASQIFVHMYDRPRISAAAITAEAAGSAQDVPTGWGRGAFGRYGYGTMPGDYPTLYGLYGYGTNAYGTEALVEGSATAVLLTFGAVSLCSPGTWAAGPCACDCVA